MRRQGAMAMAICVDCGREHRLGEGCWAAGEAKQQSATKAPTKTVSYDVHVVGNLWIGQRSAYTYKAVNWGDEKWTPSHVEKLAGDFAEVNDYEVVKHVSWRERIEGGYRSVREDTVVHPWNNQESEDLWQRLSD